MSFSTVKLRLEAGRTANSKVLRPAMLIAISQGGGQMPSTGAGHVSENLAFGAALSSLSFLCTAVMSALVKATEDLTSTAVVLLFQNLVCLLFIIPVTLRRGWASLRTDKIGLHILRAATGTAAWYALMAWSYCALLSEYWAHHLSSTLSSEAFT